MEIPRHWRLKKQRYGLEGIKITRKDGGVEYEFPPKFNPKTKTIIFSSTQLLYTSNNYMEVPEKQLQPQEQ